MGRAVGYFKKTVEILDSAKPVVYLLKSNYEQNFYNKYNEIVKMKDKAFEENKQIYFEKELSLQDI